MGGGLTHSLASRLISGIHMARCSVVAIHEGGSNHCVRSVHYAMPSATGRGYGQVMYIEDQREHYADYPNSRRLTWAIGFSNPAIYGETIIHHCLPFLNDIMSRPVSQVSGQIFAEIVKRHFTSEAILNKTGVVAIFHDPSTNETRTQHVVRSHMPDKPWGIPCGVLQCPRCHGLHRRPRAGDPEADQ